MPEPILPPTPISSTDLLGKSEIYSTHLDSGFALPPAALDEQHPSTSKDKSAILNIGIHSSTNKLSSGLSSVYQPISPCLPVDASPNEASPVRRQGSSSSDVSDDKASLEGMSVKTDRGFERSGLADHSYSLPPPPTRSRKIIQMRPCKAKDTLHIGQERKCVSDPFKHAQIGAAATGHLEATEMTIMSRETTDFATEDRTARRKHGSDLAGSSSATGRKIARKTAHSLIERRRRSKINEEFGVLKNMIPACAGQEMHKLAILQVRERAYNFSLVERFSLLR